MKTGTKEKSDMEILNNNKININPHEQEMKDDKLKNNNDTITIEQNKIKAKKKVSFIDQVEEKREIAQIIFINDKASINDDIKNSSKYMEQFRKQITNISELFKKENKEGIDTYKIKRPKKSHIKKKNIENNVNSMCTCFIF